MSADGLLPATDRPSIAEAVALAVVDALARRAAAQVGPARELLERRVQALRVDLGALRPQALPIDEGLPDSRGRPAAVAGLSDLVDRLGRSPGTADAPESAFQTASPRSSSTTPRPLKAAAAFQGTWSRLRAEQRLRQALAQVPAKAGPLHSSHVVHRALQAMQGLSPAYLDAFMSHVEALLWLEQASGGGDLLQRPAARPERGRRPGAPTPRKA